MTDPTRDLVALDRAHIWHPFTHHGLWGTESDPAVVIVGAEKNELIDAQGRRYLDAISSLWCNTLGHRVSAIDDAIRAQLERFAHSTLLGLSSEPAIRLAARLAELTPGDLSRSFFSDAGATAVELALKIAIAHAEITHGPKRRKILTLGGAYHGDTMGAVALGYSDFFHRHFSHLVFPVEKLPCTDFAHRPEGESEAAFAERVTAEAVRQVHEAGDTLCAVVMEPIIQGAAGMILQPKGFFAAIAEAARTVGSLVIADEVATGFWRTGRRFASEHENVVPDILCVAKGLTGGYLPLAATLVRPHVFEPFASGGADGRRTLFHGHTYTGNALGCAAALAATDALETLAHTGRIDRLAERLAKRLAPLHSHPHVLEVRQVGLMAGIELVAARSPRKAYDPSLRIGNTVAQEARRRGVMLRPLGPVMVLMPPFSFSDDELDRAVATLIASIDAVL